MPAPGGSLSSWIQVSAPPPLPQPQEEMLSLLLSSKMHPRAPGLVNKDAGCPVQRSFQINDVSLRISVPKYAGDILTRKKIIIYLKCKFN